jgi:hypothetical protein
VNSAQQVGACRTDFSIVSQFYRRINPVQLIIYGLLFMDCFFAEYGSAGSAGP